jgi:nicotinamide-nucleotide amidase
MTGPRRAPSRIPDDTEPTLVASGRHRTEAERLLDRLDDLDWSVAVAESLTGGLLSAALVAVSGASAHFRGGVVAYATDVKSSILGVDRDLLGMHGAVHPEVARQMADGVRRALGAAGEPTDVGISTTGIAGPVSPDGQPVGTVHIGVSTPLGTRVESLLLTGTRDGIRGEAVSRAIRLALDAL